MFECISLKTPGYIYNLSKEKERKYLDSSDTFNPLFIIFSAN